MKKTGYWKGFGSALLLVAMVTALGVTATAASRSIEVEDGIGISINGAKFTPRDADGKKVPVFLYNGTTYAPIRAVCEAAGMEVSYDSATDTVELVTADRARFSKARQQQLYHPEPGQGDRPGGRRREGCQRGIFEGQPGLG